MRYLTTLQLALFLTYQLAGQVTSDNEFGFSVPHPKYDFGKGPIVKIDEAHNNFHTSEGRYKPFADVLRLDGYRVESLREPVSAESLMRTTVLVISNPLHASNVQNWTLPTPSAYSESEISSLLTWVKNGGSLFLIVDHMPFPGAASELAAAFGLEFSNGFAVPGHRDRPSRDIFNSDTGLHKSSLTGGSNEEESITEIASFTGSAFRSKHVMTPVMVFGPNSMSREPEVAWQFTDETREISIAGWYQLAFMPFGSGRVVVSGEAAMFTAQLAGPKKVPIGMNSSFAKQNKQLLLNLMHWLDAVIEELTG